MPYSDSLAQRVRAALANNRGVVEKRMFGGVGFLLRGNMAVAIWHDALIVRVGAAEYEEALVQDFVRPFDVTGRPLTGWVMVAAERVDAERDLRAWVERGLAVAGALPPKSQGTPRKKSSHAPRRKPSGTPRKGRRPTP